LPNFLASWQLVGRAAANSARYVWPFTKGNIALILMFFIPCELFYHFFIISQKLHLEAGFPAWPAAIGMILVSLLMMLFYLMILPLRLPEIDAHIPHEQQKPFWPFVFKNTWPLCLENVRAFAVVLLWFAGGGVAAIVIATVLQVGGLLDMQAVTASIQGGQSFNTLAPSASILIAILALVALGPCIYFYLKYFFVSYAVLCEPGYEAGQINPLKFSFDKTKGLLLPLLLILAAFFWVDAFRTNLRETYPLAQAPFKTLGAALIFEIVAIYANILLFEIYRLKVKSSARVAPAAPGTPAQNI
jgi:hypothetical protein